MHYLLFYEAASDYLERRAEFRREHLTLAWQAPEPGRRARGRDPSRKQISPQGG